MAYLRLYPVVAVKVSSSLLFFLTVDAWRYCGITCCSNARLVCRLNPLSTFASLGTILCEMLLRDDRESSLCLSRNLTLQTHYRYYQSFWRGKAVQEWAG
jgi:hypothetical protein